MVAASAQAVAYMLQATLKNYYCLELVMMVGGCDNTDIEYDVVEKP